MALRSRSRTAVPTSGPGRGPASDGRIRHRGAAAGRRRARHRQPAPADELRRRAQLLFGERAEAGRESGSGPPAADEPARTEETDTVTDLDPGPLPEPATAQPSRGRPASAEAVPPVPSVPERPETALLGRGARAGLALRERLPVWMQARCGVERRGVVALAVVLVAAALFAVQHFWAGRTQTVSAPQVVRAEVPFKRKGGAGTTSMAVASPSGTPGREIVVDVTGKVRHPGIRRLPAGSRVADALRAAGGLRPGARTENLNQARFLVDGEQVAVGTPAAAPGGTGPAGAVSGSDPGPTAPVSLNTATAAQLDTLPGVGPVLAQHIIDYRTRHGGFRSVNELRQVDGIGARRYTDLRSLVTP
ncbi:ComEA family DNA-binding protein [Streptomyces sp. L2]|uniref:ComEA family DNA-binding protein n=1 Tax=Streptomyces sp. L2 TaxID=2162665 RepID=UPI00101167B4|nr:ComEA family DNA-binding protein [Streptomyces sp. L2]